MNVTLQSLKEFFVPSPVWEIDFRDVSIETKTVLYSVKTIGNLIFSILTVILGTWLGFNVMKGQDLEKSLNEIQGYVSSNEAKNTNLTKISKSFSEEYNQVASLVNAMSDNFDVQSFLQDLVQKKTDKIKFYEILIQKDKKDLKQKKTNLTVRLNGWVQKDISLVESMKNDILKCPSLSQVPNCKSFFQLDQEQNGFQQEEIKFQITLQSNE